MKLVSVLALFAFVVVRSEDRVQPLAENCNPEACKLPECRCSGSDIPGGLPARDAPQFVVLTFDYGVDEENMDTYRRILNGRVNSNNCPVSATFYMHHENNNYQLVNELYNSGFEIGLHSLSRNLNTQYWANANYDDMVKELADQKELVSHFANIPAEEIRGVRLPFLQLTGNSSFQVMADYGLTYDHSWPTGNRQQPLWPYTLDYASTQDCSNGPCPSASIPGVWVLPINSWTDLNGNPFSWVDSCMAPPDFYDSEAWYNFIISNFERQYLGNRAPFGFYVRYWFLATYPAVQNALVRFMNLVNSLSDVYMVNAGEVIDWVKDPVPVGEFASKPCRSFTPTTCPASSCELRAEHNPYQTYYFDICSSCPNVYPWLGNPLGQ